MALSWNEIKDRAVAFSKEWELPEVSSINRQFIPIGFLSADIICSNKLQIIPNGTLYLFGVLMSTMHMAWTRAICGKLKSDYSYSPVVYNNFPFPISPSSTGGSYRETCANPIRHQT